MEVERLCPCVGSSASTACAWGLDSVPTALAAPEEEPQLGRQALCGFTDTP